MIYQWFDAVVRPDERFVRLAAAEGPDFVAGYLAIESADATYQVLHVWAEDGEERAIQTFEELSEAELHHVVRVLEQHMREAPLYLQTSDAVTALTLARQAAASGHFVPVPAALRSAD